MRASTHPATVLAVSNPLFLSLYLFSIAYTGQQLVFAAKKASIERGGHGRARIIADKTNKAQRQFALSASSSLYEAVH
jgi:hypothetical protein